jgi:hypothetical protein
LLLCGSFIALLSLAKDFFLDKVDSLEMISTLSRCVLSRIVFSRSGGTKHLGGSVSHLVEAVLPLFRLFSSTGDADYCIRKHVGLAFFIVGASAGSLEYAIHDADAVLMSLA